MQFKTFFQTDEASKTILDLAQNRLMPATAELEKLALLVSGHRVNLVNSFFRKKLNELQELYQEHNKNLLVIYRLYNTPDELFSEVKLDEKSSAEKTSLILADYFNSKQMVSASFEEAFKFLEIIDRQLTKHFQSSDQRILMILSLIAVTVSFIALLLAKGGF